MCTSTVSLRARTVLDYLKTGWLKEVSNKIQPYVQHQAKLSVENNGPICGTRVVIPKLLQDTLLKSLHDTQPFITRMKALARSYFWWIGLDKDIENLGKSCESCQAVKANPTAEPLHPRVWPDAPWTHIHVDYAGQFLTEMFFILVDAHSKWPEVPVMNSTTSQSTIEALRTFFDVMDCQNSWFLIMASQFISTEFVHFLHSNGVKHFCSAPYRPSSNGQAESFVQILKRSLKASHNDGRAVSHHLAEFLLNYHTTPRASTNSSPIELFSKYSLWTRFDLLAVKNYTLVGHKWLVIHTENK